MRRSEEQRQIRAPEWVRYWLWLLIGLVIVMVAIGGATRLTGSGLSITEWKPLTGAIPPLSEAAWIAEFEKYRQSSQYALLNTGMALADFKSIYWWEWSHRQFGRAIGLAFFLPFLFLVYGWWRGKVAGSLIGGLLAICVLGALQAAVGWIMVASGLKPGMVAVEPIKLMFHLLVAACILAALVSFAVELSPTGRFRVAPRLSFWSRVLPCLVLLQIALGALVAGSKAGLTYNTWPLMDGRFVPPHGDLFVVSPWYENFIDNVTLVQFQHRMVAYALLVIAICYAWAMRRTYPATRMARQAVILAGLIFLQAGLGIVTLLLAVPLWAGLLHQMLAMLVFVTGCHHAFSAVRITEEGQALERDGGNSVIVDMDQSVNA